MPDIGDTKISKAQDPPCCIDMNKQPITTQCGKGNGGMCTGLTDAQGLRADWDIRKRKRFT